jgi:hypothetical protein
VGQCAARDGLAAKAPVIEMLALNAKIDLVVAKSFASGQLSKKQSQELIKAREVLDFAMSKPSQDIPTECLLEQISHDMRRDELTRVHACTKQMRSAEDAQSPENDSNLVQEKTIFI